MKSVIIMKKYLWCFLILLILYPTVGLDAGLLLSIFAVPLAIILVFVVNIIDIRKAMHDGKNKEK